MIYLLLSILFSTLINLIFRQFKKWSIDNLQAISWNYIACIGCGFVLNPTTQWTDFQTNWSPFALLLGFLFIGVFILMARTAQEFGVAVAAVSAKMAVIFPVLFGILVVAEPIILTTWLGIILSLVSVWFVSFSGKQSKGTGVYLLMPFLVFIGSGFIDLSLKFISWQFAPVNEAHVAMMIFGVAAIIGFTIQITKVFQKKSTFKAQNLWAGILLGIPNYFSIYFLLKAINMPEIPAVVLFPVNNIGVVLLSSLFSVLLFKEILGKRKLIGITLSIISILLLTLQLMR